MDYAELCVTTNFTFLTGASHPEEMVARATELGLSAIAITDRNSFAGVVRAFSALKEIKRTLTEKGDRKVITLTARQPVDPSSRQPTGQARTLDIQALPHVPRLIVGCRLVLCDSPVEFIALPEKKSGYQKLVRLLSQGKQHAAKGECKLHLRDMLEWADDTVLIALPQQGLSKKAETTDHIIQALRRFPGHVFTGAVPPYDGSDQDWFAALATLSHKTGAPMVAIGDVLMHNASRRQLADVLTCIRHHITIDQIGHLALPNAERRLKGAAEMERIFAAHPAALRRTVEIAWRCAFDLSELSYNYPDEIAKGEAPQARLARLTWDGLKKRNPAGIPEHHRELAEKELTLVGELGFAAYFLTVHDIITYARSKGILCQGRGSAANSILCYALGITDVSPDMIGMVFERFVSRHRGEPPDIDVDFEHERREEVIQYIYDRYGRHRAGLCATVIHFRSRSAIREVGKVMGLSNDVTSSLSSQIWGISSKGADPDRLREAGLDISDRRLSQTLRLIGEIIGFPRHLSQHVGGFIITNDRLDELCPIENAAMERRTIIEWDKDDIDALNILKVDILSLGMLTCLQKCFALVGLHYNRSLTIDTVPQEDPATYAMLTKADAVGVFQVESRAQMNFLPRMRPETFYDLVIEVAIVRPGPIQGGMVQPYIQRRQAKQKVTYPSPELEGVLQKTLGVPLFQEQAMLIAVVAAGFSAEDADRLRRSLASFRRMGTIGAFRDQFISGMLDNNYELEFAQRCFAQIEGFADYGFPESHAAAFAMLTYVSAWLKCHYPAAFACALLNAQPMGFYAPAQIVRDAREHQVEVRSISINHSEWDCTLERRADGNYALRLGFRQIKGFRKEDADWLNIARGNGYHTPEDVWLRAGLMPTTLERLAEADAFADAGLSRRDALWRVRAIRSAKPLPLFSDPIDGENISEPEVTLPAMNLGEQVVEDYVATRMSLRAHPMELLRPKMKGLTLHSNLLSTQDRRVSVCGLVITRQRPGTASGVIFLTLEDETGVSNIVVWNKIYERYRRSVMGGRLLKVTGKLQREGQVVHVIAETIEDESHRLSELGHPMDEAVGVTDPKADDTPRRTRPQPRAYHPREQAKRLFPSRDFH
ncbi:error-prone DNA polymerase [Martelella mediterranea]|uniref:Error-prone DNA polymerase n=1 Tax=Martelella mediterranea TaxID=293089 RepID=A0A4R3P2Z9_9HYPH|nr:error-prone DNA polymerase [Martelella mediterranea]TCT45098.1 DnaE-like error-prone DNA polymerase [Martelella mediterranea]